MSHFTNKDMNKQYFPFSAIVGQDAMKQALILNAVNPKVGGVLVFGEKGTAKSTAVRALTRLLPEIDVIKGCPFHCNPHNPEEMCDECHHRWLHDEEFEIETIRMPVVDLPVSATEDRVVGSLDIERKGAMSFGIAKEMAMRMGASYQKIETLTAGTIINAIERVR